MLHDSFDHGLVCDTVRVLTPVETATYNRVDWDKVTFLDVGKKREASVHLDDSWVNLSPYKKQRLCSNNFLNVNQSLSTRAKFTLSFLKRKSSSVFLFYSGKLLRKIISYPRQLNIYCPHRQSTFNVVSNSIV